VPSIVSQVLIHRPDAQYMLTEQTHGENEETRLGDRIPSDNAKHCLCGGHLGAFCQQIHAILFLLPFVVQSAAAAIVLPGMKKYHDGVPCVGNIGRHKRTEPTKPQNAPHLFMPQLLPRAVSTHHLAAEQQQVGQGGFHFDRAA
jgi:hypothetical protein